MSHHIEQAHVEQAGRNPCRHMLKVQTCLSMGSDNGHYGPHGKWKVAVIHGYRYLADGHNG